MSSNDAFIDVTFDVTAALPTPEDLAQVKVRFLTSRNDGGEKAEVDLVSLRLAQLVGETTTEIVAYESDGAFIQLWIGADDKLPRMARAVYTGDPAQLRHQVKFSDWQLDMTVPSDAFTSQQAASAARIPFARPDAGIAGLELDLGELRRLRGRSISFGLFTLVIPVLVGVAIGLAHLSLLGGNVIAALLIGALMAGTRSCPGRPGSPTGRPRAGSRSPI